MSELSNIDAQDVVDEFGNYYVNEGQNMDRLKSVLYGKSDTPSKATPAPTESEFVKNTVDDLGEVVQGYQEQWTPKGRITFKPRPAMLRSMKIDMELNPDRLRSSYLGYLTTLQNTDRANWPFVRWLLEERVIQRYKADLENKAYGKGVYEEVTPGTAQDASKVMDGIKKMGADCVNEGGHLLTLDTAINDGNALDSFEALAKKLPTEWEGEDVVLLADPVLVNMYLRDKRNTLGGNPTYEKGALTIDFSDYDGEGGQEIEKLRSLRGTGIIVPTIKGNFKHMTGIGNLAGGNFHVESAKRQVHVYTDWMETLHFDVAQLVGFYDNNDPGGDNFPSASGSAS